MRTSNTIDANDPRVLDRLVDGELTDTQERSVIAQLSQIPDGWQRCALAFLEARCLERTMPQLLQRAASDHSPVAAGETPAAIGHAVGNAVPGTPGSHTLAQPPAEQQLVADLPVRKQAELKHTAPRAFASSSRSSARWLGALSLCVLFLLAFGVGTFLPNPWHRFASQPSQPTEPVHRPNELVENGTATPPIAPLDVPIGSQPQDPLHDSPLHNSQGTLLGNLQFVGNTGQQVNVPVYDWNQQVAEQLMYRPQPLSPELVQQLKRHQVRSHRSYVPVKLEDGRRVVLPVQTLEIEPVGGTAY